MTKGKMTIGIMGAIKAGKDTAGMLLGSIPGVFTTALANGLKEEVLALYPSLFRPQDLGFLGKENWSGPKTGEARQKLQEQGERQRKMHGFDYWLKKLQEKIQSNPLAVSIITDVRHINEIEWILRQPCHRLICIQNLSADAKYLRDLQDGAAYTFHRSEIEWRAWLNTNLKVATIIHNDQSMMDFGKTLQSVIGCHIIKFIEENT